MTQPPEPERADLALAPGERYQVGERLMRLTPRLEAATIAARGVLTQVASARGTITYGELSEEILAAGGPRVLPRHLGPVLAMLDHDCVARGEPGLASLVVSAAGGEVGTADTAWAPPQREVCWRYWCR